MVKASGRKRRRKRDRKRLMRGRTNFVDTLNEGKMRAKGHMILRQKQNLDSRNRENKGAHNGPTRIQGKVSVGATETKGARGKKGREEERYYRHRPKLIGEWPSRSVWARGGRGQENLRETVEEVGFL